MVEKHGITPEVAHYHVSAMNDAEVKARTRAALQSILDQIARRWKTVSGLVFRGQNGAIGNLTTNGMEYRAGKNLPMPVVESFPDAFFAAAGVAGSESEK